MASLQYTDDNWLGEVPAHWPIVPSKSLFTNPVERNHGDDIHLTPSQKFGVIPQSDYMEITGNRVVLNLSGADNMRHVEPGDFVSHLRSFQGGLEYSAYKGKVSSAYTVLRPKQQIEPRFYKYLFKSGRYVQGLATTTEQLRDGQSIRYQQFSLLPLPYPPIEEQRAIADFLDRELRQIDRLIQTQERLEALLTERWQGILKATLDPNTMTNSAELFADVPQGWRKGHLKHFAEVKLGKMVEKTDDQKSEGALPYLRAASIQPYGKISLDDANYMPFTPAELVKFSLIKGDVVVVEGGSIGRAAFIEHDMHGWGFQNSINRLRPKGKTNGKYLCYLMQYIELTGLYRTIVNTSTISHLTAEKLQVVKVALPPVHMQQELAQVLDERLESLTNGLRNIEMLKLTLRERRTAFVNAAVTGKIDVRGKS